MILLGLLIFIISLPDKGTKHKRGKRDCKIEKDNSKKILGLVNELHKKTEKIVSAKYLKIFLSGNYGNLLLMPDEVLILEKEIIEEAFSKYIKTVSGGYDFSTQIITVEGSYQCWNNLFSYNLVKNISEAMAVYRLVEEIPYSVNKLILKLNIVDWMKAERGIIDEVEGLDLNLVKKRAGIISKVTSLFIPAKMLADINVNIQDINEDAGSEVSSEYFSEEEILVAQLIVTLSQQIEEFERKKEKKEVITIDEDIRNMERQVVSEIVIHDFGDKINKRVDLDQPSRS